MSKVAEASIILFSGTLGVMMTVAAIGIPLCFYIMKRIHS